MGGLYIDDPDYLELALSVVCVVVVLLACKYRERHILPHIVVSFEVATVFVFLWNSVVPSEVQINNPLYMVVAIVGATAGVCAIWHAAMGLVTAVLLVAFALALLVAGRDKVSTAFGGLSYYWLAGIFLASVLVLAMIYRFFIKWDGLWDFVGVLFIGLGMGMAVDVIRQEASTGRYDLDMLDFTERDFLYCLFSSEVLCIVLYYRDRLMPCWFRERDSSPPPEVEKRNSYSPLPAAEE